MIFAKSGDVDFIQKIKNSNLSGFVHSIFHRTFNFQCLEDGELYTVACNEIDNAPNTLVIDVDCFDRMDLKIKDTIYVENQILHIANKLSIHIVNVEQWESKLPLLPNNIERLKDHLAFMKNYIDLHGKSGGIKKAPIFHTSFEKEMSKLLQERTGLLLNDLANNRMTSALQHAESLIGLGSGLTPSGDDFLVGILTILNTNSGFTNKSFCEEVVKKAKSLTNEISYMAIKKASIGKVRESLIQLIHSLINGTEEDLILSLNKVLNIGSSSGTDIALGLVCGLEAKIKAGGRL
ncbi:hypothetical protein CN692_14425 [Bacillus sp. AFS002410]|uniref:DUF2877 domain-containing protein n=1 Tax=Bacillus sp. AFS002410 TaxID=2033481 RepID=UPI000BF02BE4|nr:DUF2877 domain-containing protein [Bacillus sp. AFS002410]PEJ57143.1 hypothetical protein CN692_14425 [Bacillus sp. AFS002410]